MAALPIVEGLLERYPQEDIAFSVTTKTGIETARAHLSGKVGCLFTLPVDCLWSFRRVVQVIDPTLFMLIETDLWPGLLGYLKQRGVKLLLVNGKTSPATLRFYRAFPFFSRMLLGCLDLSLMQSALERSQLLPLGVKAERIEALGNIKFDRSWVTMTGSERRYWMNQLGLEHKDRIWVAGSTHEGEERMILSVFDRLRRHYPSLRLVIAPRNVKRSREILAMVCQMGLSGRLRSDAATADVSSEVVILDTLGELDRVYGIAAVSFVGGTLIPDGGHNLLEPASFGCPVLFGPYTYDFAAMAESLEAAGGGRRVKDQDGLQETVDGLLASSPRREEMGCRARDFVVQNQGVLNKTLGHIDRFLA